MIFIEASFQQIVQSAPLPQFMPELPDLWQRVASGTSWRTVRNTASWSHASDVMATSKAQLSGLLQQRFNATVSPPAMQSDASLDLLVT
jgi:hypothetical protein